MMIKIKNLFKITTFIILIMLACIWMASAQHIFDGDTLIHFKSLNEDTIYVTFGDNFHYDVVALYVNGIRVYENILYSSKDGVADGTRIYHKTDSVELKLIFYQRNHKHSFEYNALWYDWNWSSEAGVYYPKRTLMFTVNPQKHGKYVEIYILKDLKDKDGRRYKPYYKIKKGPTYRE